MRQRQSAMSIGPLLDQLLNLYWLPACRATRMRDLAELPPRLEDCVRRLPPYAEWRVYLDGAQLYCAIARAVTPIADEAGSVALEVHFLDSSASIGAAGVWQCTSRRGWRLIEVLEPAAAQWLSWRCPSTLRPRGERPSR